MPRLIVTETAVCGLERCRLFLNEQNPTASQKAAETIARSLTQLTGTPAIGRPVRPAPLRELVIPFGDTGYVALYRYEAVEDAVYILAFRHQREAGFGA